jgi:hypothetical protein
MKIHHTWVLAALAAVTGVGGSTISARANEDTAINTGLDLTQPLNAIGYTYGRNQVSPGVTLNDDAIDASFAWAHRNQVSALYPYRGSVGLQYDFVVPSNGRVVQAFGTGVTLKSGDLNGTRETQFAPLYVLSYHPNRSTSLLLRTQYAVGANPSDGTPRYNELSVSPSAIVTLPRSAYVALAPRYERVSGDVKNTTYDATFTLGKVILNRYNVSAYYDVPMNGATYSTSFNSRFGVKVSLQQ